ncbi:MAG: hypothetical protein QF551_02300 [Candidatus Marinimicrobia bacterium]|nr:hypothetical protein [Candidatus Neomarinimicrobiota bacterium]
MKQKVASATLYRWQIVVIGFLIFSLNVGKAQPADTTASILDDSSAVVQVIDPWFSKDKVYHFVLSYAWVGGSYCLMAQNSDLPAESAMAIAVSSGIVLGLVKEIMDSRRPGGFFSKKDLIFNLAGAVAAALTFRNRD